MKHFFGLILDDGDPAEGLLIALLRAYEAQKRPVVENGSDKSVSCVCPYCGRVFGFDSRRGARIGMAAHYRQIHPEES